MKMKMKMKRFKKWVLENYIKEEWTDLTTIGKICIYPFWLIRSILIWSVSPILLLYYIFINSKTYKNIETEANNKLLDFLENNHFK